MCSIHIGQETFVGACRGPRVPSGTYPAAGGLTFPDPSRSGGCADHTPVGSFWACPLSQMK
jgi:hypothetical protein